MNTVQSGTQTVRKKDTLEEELTISSVEKRNWRGIFIALLVIAGVLGLIIFSIFLLSPDLENVKQFRRRLSINDVINNKLFHSDLNASFISDTEVVYRDGFSGLSILNLKSMTIKRIINDTIFRQLGVDFYSLSPDKNFALLYNMKPNSIRDNENNNREYTYYIYEIATQSYSVLSPNRQTLETEKSALGIQKVIWAPKSSNFYNSSERDSLNTSSLTNKHHQALAFVYKNDIYYKFDVQEDTVTRVTKTGTHNLILNGIPDWMYSFSSELNTETLAFSFNANYLAFLSFNITDVQLYKFTSNFDDSTNYPSIKSIKYPKTNTPNPFVTVNVVDTSTSVAGHLKKIYIPLPFQTDYYVGGLVWVSNTELSFTCTDRKQTKSITYLCKAPTFECVEVFIEEQFEDGFVLPSEKPIFIKKRFNNQNDPSNQIEESYILKRIPIRVGKSGVFRHLVARRISNIKNNNKIKRYILSFGRFEVTEILNYSPEDHTIFYMATLEKRPGYRHLYKLKLNFNLTNDNIFLMAGDPVCLTCQSIVENQGIATERYNDSFFLDTKNRETSCLFNKVHIGPRHRFYIQECLGPDPPTSFIIDLKTNRKIMTWNDGLEISQYLSKFAIPTIKKFGVLVKNGFEAQVKLYLPPNLDEEQDIAYPLILNTCSEPGKQLVSEQFNIDWNWYLSSSKSIIVAQVDTHASGYQGEHFQSQIKRKLASIEVEDQLTVLSYLKDNFQFIDARKIGVYGWGYGGYTALQSIADDNTNLLRFAIAVAPIVSFKFYYSFFSERFLPIEENFNRLLYDSDLATKARNFDQKNIFLVQGTSDKIVHQQHSLWLAKALIKNGVEFRQQIYADEDHDLEGVKDHFYKTMESFIDDHFGLNEDIKLNGLFGFKK